MAEETTATLDNPETSAPETPTPETATAVANLPAGESQLTQTVEVKDVGPCKKHVRVVVDRKAIDERFAEKYSKLARESKAQLDGFRPGKAPRAIVVRRFKTAVTEEVRNEVLMASLEQLATENKISPLSPPDINPEKIEIPDEGPFIYEFQVEVRPEFDLPNYKGLKLRKPVKEFGAVDFERERQRLLEPYGELVEKMGANVAIELNDTIETDITLMIGTQEINKIDDARVRVVKQLVLQDGVAENFGKQLTGKKVGDEPIVDIAIGAQAASPALRNQNLEARFKIKAIKIINPPVLTTELLQNEFGVRNEEQFEELIEVLLQRRLEYLQNQTYREQILASIGEAGKWDLPRDLLIRQSKRALSRRVMEMQSAGIPDDQIAARQQMMQQDVIRSTASALREHFVLQKIAEVENLEIKEEDIDEEIGRIADRENESPRKVRARMEREDMLEALATDLLERRALKIVLDNAEYEEYALVEDGSDEGSTSVEAQAVPGQMDEPAVAEEAIEDK